MPLSRLDNFLKNVRGNILYVDPNSLDATDSITNQGNSLARPFKTIQRALVESSRFSYQRGLDNDRFEKTTIMLAPGEHFVDNRPGWIPDGSGNYKLRNGLQSADFAQFDVFTNFDVKDPNNQLYKLNSVSGGVIIPRGTSIVGQDLRKCKVRPLYVPNPLNSDIERSAVFKVTGGCYLNQFTVFDGDPNGNVYKDYTDNRFVPNFSHHKLTTFEYADGVNNININDAFLTYSTDRTDLDIYYEKVGLAYGPSSGRAISPDYPASGVDIEPKIDEFRIVGPTGGTTGISSIRSGDGTTASTTITVNLSDGIDGLNVDTYFQVNGTTDDAYNGTFVATQILSQNADGETTSFTYETATVPSDALPSVTGVTIELSTDTVSGASPYIFNVSLRSVYGMCGMHADGSKAAGFKSMVVAQFTGVSLQVDDNAFVKYNDITGSYDDSTTVANIHSDADAKYKPEYENFHIKASNNSVIQLVSIFAIGFSDHFVTESGGDFSVTNSNSNFGQTALRSSGFRAEAFAVDDIGYVSNLIPPRRIDTEDINLEYSSIDVSRTVGVGSTSRLYLHNQTNPDVKPESKLQGYRIGAKVNDRLYVVIPDGTSSKAYSARIVMDDPGAPNNLTSVKESVVGRAVGTGNSISANVITFTADHHFSNGESIRIISDDSRLPDGLESSYLYYAITTGVNANQIKIAQTAKDAEFDTELTLNNLGGNLKVQSRVNDKVSGDVGHPIQYDTDVNQWYVSVGAAATDNDLYSKLVSLGTTALGDSTSRTYITRTPDSRSSQERIYQYRYVIPAASGIGTARVPKDSFALEQSNTVSAQTDTEAELMYNPGSVTMSNSGQLRNPSYIANATYSGGIAVYETEKDHQLSIGSTVEVNNVTSTNFTVGTAQSGYNGKFRVIGIQSARSFSVEGVTSDPGTFTNNTSNRNTSLPTFKRKNFNNNYYVYDVNQVSEYVPGQQDGVYHLQILNTSNTPQVSPFNDSDKYGFKQPIVNLYPQLDRDNPTSDPIAAVTYALPDKIGKTVISEPQNSVTKETIDKITNDINTGVGITDIQSSADGSSITIFTDRDHGLRSLIRVSIASSGAGYGSGSGGVENIYNAILSGSSAGTGALARITVDPSGGVTDIKVQNGGSGYVPTETLNIVGTAQTTGYTQASVTVDKVYNNLNDTIQVAGIFSVDCQQYNQLYRISEIISNKSVRATPVDIITSGISTTGIGSIATTDASFRLTGPTLGISTFVYDNVSGLATVTTNQGHGFRVNNTVRIGGATTDFFNKEFLVTDNVGINTFTINVGINTVNPGTGGTIRAYYPGNVSQGGPLISGNEELYGGRDINAYAGITTVISSPITSATTDEIFVRNLPDFNLQIGDYLRVDDEIVRIKTTVTSNPVKVFRGVMGTRPTTHEDEGVIKKVYVAPVEFRRNSIIRASGHTFEYLGYGPGNYSTSLPIKQKKQLSTEDQLISQSQSTNGGVVVYTGMNDSGDFFIGNKRISSNTGKEIVYDTPVQTVTGEDFVNGERSSLGIDALETQELTASRTLRVNGGPDQSLLSEFDGPVVFNEKLTSTSDKGIEANSLFLQGDAVVSRNYTVGIATPTEAGNPGDVVYNGNPTKGGTIGWTYTVENGWYAFGAVTSDNGEFIFEKVGIGTTTAGDCTLKVGSGSSEFCVNEFGVGVGGSMATTSHKMIVNGAVVATAFTGDGSGLTNLQNDSLFRGVQTGLGTGIYPINSVNVGFGTTVFNQDFTVKIGSPGTAKTDLYVSNASRFISTADFTDVNSTGTLISSEAIIGSGSVQAGLITATSELRVGVANTVFSATTTNGVGIGTSSPRENLDVEGRARLKSYYETDQNLVSISNRIEIDIARGQAFSHTTTESVNDFRIINPPSSGVFAFTVKFVQGTTPRGVGIDTFVNSVGNAVNVFWPGGIAPVLTQSGGATDIYSFMSFDGGSTLYGGVVGQNFT